MIFFDKSPLAMAVVTSAMLRTCAVRFEAIEFTESVKSFHVPADAEHVGLAAELAFGADFARNARHLAGEGVELVDHGVHGLFELQDFARDVDGDLLRQVAAGDGGRRLRRCCAPAPSGSAAMKLTLSVRSFHVPATPGTAA